MAAKDVKFGNDARVKMLRGVAFWADSFQRKRKRPKKFRKIFFGR